jgi:predicted nucleotidyltransferase
MFQLEKYLQDITDFMKEAFGQRLLYVGLQGSYMRGEATETSDIDIMVVIKDITKKDLDVYREIILELPDHEKSCGFICGLDELFKGICHTAVVIGNQSVAVGYIAVNLTSSCIKARNNNTVQINTGGQCLKAGNANTRFIKRHCHTFDKRNAYSETGK